jgi:hypothetical protein
MFLTPMMRLALGRLMDYPNCLSALLESSRINSFESSLKRLFETRTDSKRRTIHARLNRLIDWYICKLTPTKVSRVIEPQS